MDDIIATVAKSTDPLVKAIMTGSTGLGREVAPDGTRVIAGRYLDAYLLLATLAQRIENGDMKLIEIGDSIDRRDYYNKLLESCKNIDLSPLE